VTETFGEVIEERGGGCDEGRESADELCFAIGIFEDFDGLVVIKKVCDGYQILLSNQKKEQALNGGDPDSGEQIR